MEPWFSGAVVEAVREAKTRRALFLVYVRDQSEQSQLLDQLWATVWSKTVETSSIIALRLDKDTEACKQFTAIYKVQNYPTVYLINGQNGQVLKMVDQKLDDANQLEEILQESLNAIQPKKGVEEKVAEARARLKELHDKREEESKDKEKEEEVSRRRVGQQMLLDKQKKQEESIRQQAEELRRDKLEQQKLQEKLKVQIQQDREDKRRKFEQEQTANVQAKTPPRATTNESSTPKTNYTRSRLQFRLGDGSFFTEDFSTDDHMSDVYSYLQQTLPSDQYPNGAFLLRTVHTRVTLPRDSPSTLKELELVPSAVLLVLNRANPSSSGGNLAQSNLFQSIPLMFTWLMMQLNFLYQFVFAKLFGARTQTATNNHQSRERKSPTPTASKENFRTDTTEKSTIRRFHNTQDDSDDEEKRTWNGNSTEQM